MKNEKEYSIVKLFSDGIKHENRFFVSKDITDRFDGLIQNSTQVIIAGTKLYRGRYIPYPRNKRNMKPLKVTEYGIPPQNKTSNGRANPYGINYLYLATNKNTVVAELRENIDSLISIGTFKVITDISVVRLTNYAVCSTSDFNYATFHIYLSSLLTQPVRADNSVLDYLPMQFFAEYCKNKNNISGIQYLSCVMDNYYPHQNYNIALFDESQVECIDSSLVRVKKILYEYDDIL